MTGRTFVAGVGNIFLGDDGFGVEVARRLAERPLPPGVRVADMGIRGVHLAYELLDGYDTVVLVDAMACGEPPGTVFVMEPEIEVPDAPVLDAHRMDPAAVLATVARLGGEVKRLLLVGCEPAQVDEGIGLSEPVARAVDRAVQVVEDLLEEVLNGEGDKEARC